MFLPRVYDGIYTIGSTVFDAVNYAAVDIMAIEKIPVVDEAHLKSFVIETRDGAAAFEKETQETVTEDGSTSETYTWYRLESDGSRTLMSNENAFRFLKLPVLYFRTDLRQHRSLQIQQG